MRQQRSRQRRSRSASQLAWAPGGAASRPEQQLPAALGCRAVRPRRRQQVPATQQHQAQQFRCLLQGRVQLHWGSASSKPCCLQSLQCRQLQQLLPGWRQVLGRRRQATAHSAALCRCCSCARCVAWLAWKCLSSPCLPSQRTTDKLLHAALCLQAVGGCAAGGTAAGLAAGSLACSAQLLRAWWSSHAAADSPVQPCNGASISGSGGGASTPSARLLQQLTPYLQQLAALAQQPGAGVSLQAWGRVFGDVGPTTWRGVKRLEQKEQLLAVLLALAVKVRACCDGHSSCCCVQ